MIVRKGQRLGSVLADRASTEPAPQPTPAPLAQPASRLTETEQEANRQAAEARAQRPPTSGPGSGVEAWRRYAADVTDSPPESWSSLTRDEIIELLDSEGVSHGA